MSSHAGLRQSQPESGVPVVGLDEGEEAVEGPLRLARLEQSHPEVVDQTPLPRRWNPEQGPSPSL